jgi:hypothetical protein
MGLAHVRRIDSLPVEVVVRGEDAGGADVAVEEPTAPDRLQGLAVVKNRLLLSRETEGQTHEWRWWMQKSK